MLGATCSAQDALSRVSARNNAAPAPAARCGDAGGEAASALAEAAELQAVKLASFESVRNCDCRCIRACTHQNRCNDVQHAKFHAKSCSHRARARVHTSTAIYCTAHCTLAFRPLIYARIAHAHGARAVLTPQDNAALRADVAALQTRMLGLKASEQTLVGIAYFNSLGNTVILISMKGY